MADEAATPRDEGVESGSVLWIALGPSHQHPDTTHALALLRTDDARHRDCARQTRNEFAPPHHEQSPIRSAGKFEV
jgi:hypothetical protein